MSNLGARATVRVLMIAEPATSFEFSVKRCGVHHGLCIEQGCVVGEFPSGRQNKTPTPGHFPDLLFAFLSHLIGSTQIEQVNGRNVADNTNLSRTRLLDFGPVLKTHPEPRRRKWHPGPWSPCGHRDKSPRPELCAISIRPHSRVISARRRRCTPSVSNQNFSFICL